MEEECEYYESRARGPIGPDAKYSTAKPGRKIKFTVLPLTFQKIDELGRIATEQNIPFDTLVQRSLQETIQRYKSSARVGNKLPAKRPPAKKAGSSRPKTPASA